MVMLVETLIPRTELPQDGARLDPANPIARLFQAAYLPAVSGNNLGFGAQGAIPSHSQTRGATAAGPSVLFAATTQADRAFGPTPTYPLLTVCVVRQTSTANATLFELAGASGLIGGSSLRIGGGSSTQIQYTVRANFSSTVAITATVPADANGNQALNQVLVIVTQTLSATDHRVCVNGSAVTTSTTSIGTLPAWDRLTFGTASGNVNLSAALFGFGGPALSDADMQRLSRSPSEVWALFEPQRLYVPVAVASGGSFSATGALSADAATVSGSASHLALHSASGALSADVATVAGTAAHLTLHTATGALIAEAATVAGSASLSSAGAFSATGALSSDAATLSGAAVHYTLHTATGAIAADAATVAGTATHLTLHTATGDLIADPASLSGVAVHTGDGAVIEARNVGAGKARRKSQRYVLAIDGKDVIVSDYAEAQALIDRAKEEAEAKADEALQRANASQRRPIGKVIRDARKALKAPSIEAPPELADYARKVIADIQATYDQRLRDIEITALMRQRERQQEEDDEEVLMLIA